ncbi:hypothetical protein HDU76_004244 [Blyttiomyces sp. JEL0837]|nr:hypothetical protein HDU76_004244 [Blyttiomyces sp. JEL0837]
MTSSRTNTSNSNSLIRLLILSTCIAATAVNAQSCDLTTSSAWATCLSGYFQQGKACDALPANSKENLQCLCPVLSGEVSCYVNNGCAAALDPQLQSNADLACKGQALPPPTTTLVALNTATLTSLGVVPTSTSSGSGNSTTGTNGSSGSGSSGSGGSGSGSGSGSKSGAQMTSSFSGVSLIITVVAGVVALAL